MLKRYQQFVGGTFRVVDAAVIGAVWLLSYPLRFSLPFHDAERGFPFEEHAALLPLVMILWMMVFSGMKVYQSRRMLRRTHEVYLLIKAHGVALLLFIALTYLISEMRYSRGIMIYFGFLSAVFLVVFRLSLRNALRSFRKRGFNLRHVIVVGEGPSLDELVFKMEKYPELGIRVMGAIVSATTRSKTISGKPVFGHFVDIAKILRKHNVDEVLIALPRKQYAEIDTILSSIRDETIDVRFVPDVHEYVTLGCEVEDFDGIPIVNINESAIGGWGWLFKRVTDILVASLALIILAPFLVLIAFIIKMTSPGPTVFRQERMGLDGKTFAMLKFRSMKSDAEAETGAVWANSKDDRRTKFGSFLRATSLDELPQLLNVLSGDMSLVGPRPERPVFVKKFKNEIPFYMLRHKMKAGMTGWAQINGWRGNTSLKSRIEFDLYYIRNWSYMLDWKIMILTLWKGFVNKNAY